MIVLLQQSNTNTTNTDEGTDTDGAGSASIVHPIVTNAQPTAMPVGFSLPSGNANEIENMSMQDVTPAAFDANAFASYEIVTMTMPGGDIQTVAVAEDGVTWRRVVTGTDGTYSFVNDEQWQTTMDTTTVVQYSQPPQEDPLSKILSTLNVLTNEVQKLRLDGAANTKSIGENTAKLDQLLHLAGASSGPSFLSKQPECQRFQLIKTVDDATELDRKLQEDGFDRKLVRTLFVI